MQKIKYITNKDLLAEIKICKATYCHFTSKEHATYHAIVDLGSINPELVADTINVMANKQSTKLAVVNPASIAPDSVVFRVMTDAHLPPTGDKNKRRETSTGEMIKTNFNPFRHFILQGEELVEVGRSHWRGDFDSGKFSVVHGAINNRLAGMFMLLVEQYSRRGNWRGYCVDEETEALTQRGWLGIDEINETDMILSYDELDGKMKWSRIKSIFRDFFDGKMFKLDVTGMDALVTPHHKFITDAGMKEVDLLTEKDRLVLMGDAVEDGAGEYSDAFVELVGWAVTEGNYYLSDERNYTRVTIYQNEGEYADRIRTCLDTLDTTFSEYHRDNPSGKTAVAFHLPKKMCQKILAVAEDKVLSMQFILSLTQLQRVLLINTMIDADGWRTKTYLRYCQKDRKHIDAFLMLCTIAGFRATLKSRNIVSYDKPTQIYHVNIFSDTARSRVSMVENIDFHGGKRNGRSHPGQGKQAHPNEPTFDYDGRVWCPETEYGTFMARRNGTIYLTHNTYVDEMRSHALVQLAQVGLQFDESRSDNPFAFYTQIIKNCFRRVLNLERRNQDIRDDLLIMAGAMPSYTRQVDNEIDQRDGGDPPIGDKPARRGRKPKLQIKT